MVACSNWKFSSALETGTSFTADFPLLCHKLDGVCECDCGKHSYLQYLSTQFTPTILIDNFDLHVFPITFPLTVGAKGANILSRLLYKSEEFKLNGVAVLVAVPGFHRFGLDSMYIHITA